MAILEVKNLSYSYEDDTDVLAGVSFSIEEGSITAIIGLSGCGKTTLCYALCGVIPAVLGGRIGGEIRLEGEDISQYPLSQLASKIGLVMQNPDDALVTTTVEDELAFAPENLCLPPKEIRAKVDATLELLQLKELRLYNPERLSGGQKQLVALGAVLTLEPRVLVLDEPFSQLDQSSKNLVRKTLLHLRQTGKTILFVEHDLEEARFADRWLVMSKGRLVCLDTPQNILADTAILYAENLMPL